MKKRILSILVVLCLAVALPVVAFAAEEPAQIEVATLESLQAALADNTNNLPIVIKETIVIPADDTVVMDLNGKTVVVPESTGNHQYALRNLGTLTLKDTKGNGSITARGIYNGADGTNTTAQMFVESGKYVGQDSNGGAAIFNYAVLTVTGGEFVGAACCINSRTGSVTTISGGTYSGNSSNYQIQNNGGAMTINNATVTAGFGAVGNYGGTTVINGGTFLPTGSAGKTCHVVYVAGGANVTINGGTYKMNYPANAVPDSGSAVASYYNGTLLITGGTFTSHFDNVSPIELSKGATVEGGTYKTHSGAVSTHPYVTAYMAEGCKFDAETGVIASAKAYAAEVGGTKYETLADAIAVGGEVKLLANIELTAPIVIEKGQEVVLNLGAYKISYTSTNMGEAMITNKGTLTINGAEGSEIYYNYVGANDASYGKGNYTIANYSKLTVNGGKIYGEKLSGHAKYPIDNNSTIGDAELIINGGHLYNYNTSAIRQFCNSTVYKNTVTINDGLVEGYCAIWVQNPGNKTVNSELTINGGEIKSTAKAYVNGTSKLEEVSSAIYYTIAANGGAWSEDSFVALNGGTFNENVYLVESAPEAITIGEKAIFNGYLEVPVTEPTLIVDENNTLVMTDTQENHINHRVTVYFLGDETVEDIYDEAALKAIDAEAKTYWGAAEINKVQLTKTGNYVLVLNYNNGVGTKKETVCVAASVVVPEQVLPTLDVKDNKVVVTEGDANVGNYRAVVYYLGNQTVTDITDEAALKAIDPSAKTYWGLKEIEKVHLLKSGNYVVHLQYNIGKGTKQTVATAATVEFSDLTLKVVDGKLVAADPENAYIHHRAVVYYLGDETVEDIYDEAALKAIDASAKTYWGLNAINKAKLTQSGNYVVLLQYNLEGSAKMTIAVSVNF